MQGHFVQCLSCFTKRVNAVDADTKRAMPVGAWMREG